MSSTSYLALLKALYDYETPQSDDELAIKEDQLLFLIEKVDEDWWKVKIKPDSPDDEGPSGLVPSAYVEEVPHKQLVKALYDYDANASGELTVKEDDLLYSYETDDGWTLVKSQERGTVGYVPGNYIEEIHENGTASNPPPPSPSPPQSPAAQATTPISQLPPQHILTGEKGKADDIQTWSLSELDKKGKKKKGTLGVGGGAVFFASETDKTPVRKWPISDVDAVKTEKGKHVIVEIGGAEPTVLRFHAGSKDAAEAVLKKLEHSIDISTESVRMTTPPAASRTPIPPSLPPIQTAPAPSHAEDTKKNAVRFAVSSPSIITRSEDGEEEVPEGAVEGLALYDFTAGGDDELTVNEGDHLLVLDRNNEDWWTCRNQHGLEGVIPASYIECAQITGQITGHNEAGSAPEPEEEDENELIVSREAAEREEMLRDEELRREEEEEEERVRVQKREREEREAKRKEKEKTEARRRELEQRKKEQEKRAAAAATAAAAEAESEAAATAEAARKEESREKERQTRRAERKTVEKSRTFPKSIRTWHDKTGQFQVDAEFLGQHDGKLRLHKSNGVIIEVPVSKMSAEDMEYVRRLQKKKAASTSRSSGAAAANSDVNNVTESAKQGAAAAAARSNEPRAPRRKGPTIDWFEFFLNAGCDIDECTRYASAFERDKIDESLLGELKDGTLRSLGLKEGDILRVLKAIQQRTGGASGQKQDAEKRRQSQMEEDEKLARQLQAQENGDEGQSTRHQGSASPAPNLFAGPGGALKNNTRRGRPQPSKSAPPLNVDIDSIGSNQPSTGNLLESPQVLSPQQGVKRTTSTTPSQFDDDAWTNRPSSTAPIAPSPAAPSIPTPPPPPSVPAQSQVQVPVSIPVVASQNPPVQATPPTSTSPASTTRDSNFEILAKITAMQSNRSPAINTPPIQSPPAGFQTGLGVGSSSLPMAQHIQNQQTGLYNLQQSQPRGPLAPTSSNQPLLNPLIPTNTGFNSFVPTRPGSNPPPVPPLPSFLSNPPSFRPQSSPLNPLAAQPTGFVPSGFGGIQTQPTGFPSGSFGNFQPNPGLSNPSFMGNASPMQSGFAGATSGNFPNFMPPATSPPPDNHSPANIFAQMKSGTFGKDDSPQSADKYDALRMNNAPQITSQPTGWGVQPNFSSPYTSYRQ